MVFDGLNVFVLVSVDDEGISRRTVRARDAVPDAMISRAEGDVSWDERIIWATFAILDFWSWG